VPPPPASLIEPLWVEFATPIGSEERPEFSPPHPWGCHRRRISDRVVFDHVIAAPVHGSGDERIASPGCPDRTIRRRLAEWAAPGAGKALLRIALTASHRMIGLDLQDLAVDGAITQAPCGGEVAGRSPVDRGKQGTKRSVAGDATASRCTWWPPAPTTTTHRCSNPPWPGAATSSAHYPTPPLTIICRTL
jgi:hypothetical protein